MKLNNKGLTLVELLLSIVLIGIVLLFIFQLLVDLRGETDSNSYAYNNQLNRMDAIYKIEKDITNNHLSGIVNRSSGKKTIIDFNFSSLEGDKTTTLTIEKRAGKFLSGDAFYINYKDYDRNVNTWEMKGVEIDNCFDYNYYFDNTSGNFYFKLNFYVYNKPYHDLNNKDHNNVVDDIEINYVGNINDINKSITNNILGDTNKNINACTNY